MESKNCHTHNHPMGAHKACVSLVPIFNHLENEQIDEIMEMVQSVSYKRGEIIYRAEDPSDSLYIVHKGKIRMYRLSESGKEQLVRILLPGILQENLLYLKKRFMKHLRKQWKKLKYVPSNDQIYKLYF